MGILLPIWLQYLTVVFFGACVGSFANVCIFRLPLGASVVRPRSMCPRCKAMIHWYDNVPIFSYVILRGKCRKCGARISPRYLIVELLTTLLSVATFVYFRDMAHYFAYFLFLVVPLVVVSFIDLEHRIIPDVISLPGVLAGLLTRLAFAKGNWTEVGIDSLIGIVVGVGFLCIVGYGYEIIKKQEGLGGGDVKLAGMLGAFFGWKAIIFILLMSSLLGSVVGLIFVIIMKRDLKYAIPYGPFMSMAALIYLFFGEPILRWYLGLFS